MTKIRTPIRRTLLLLSAISIVMRLGLSATAVRSQSVSPPAITAATANTLVDRAGGAYEGVAVILQVESAPSLGGSANFTFQATPLHAAPDLTLSWELPDGGTLLGGPASTIQGAVLVGNQVRETRQVQFPATGIYTVRAQATYHPDPAITLTAVGVLFITIDADGSSVTDSDPRLPRYTPPTSRPTIDKSSQVIAANPWGTNVPEGCFTVTGILTRGERQPAANPPRYNDVGGSAVPVHNILVEMREEDTFSDDSYGYTVTDANGKFSFSFCDDDGFLNDELELYTRVCSEVWEGPTRIARIEETSEQELYCFDSGIIDSEGGPVDFGLTAYAIPSLEAAIFNIGDSLYWAWKYWNSNLGQGSPAMTNTVTVFWERGKNAKGSFYSAQRTTLVIADDASSTDEWDDSVIMHEWGHFADHQFSCNLNPGGVHTLPGFNNGANGDKLSWGEGFADYYQSAARTIMPGSGFTNYYIDVSGPTVDFETLPGTASPLNEGAVAAMLWDFLDTANDGSDTISPGQASIQKVFTDPSFQGNGQCNMARFLKVWKNLNFPTDAQTAATVVQNVAIANPFAISAAEAAASLVPAAQQTAVLAPAATNAASPFDYRWWDQVTMVIDNSTSMAGPAGTPKIDATKALIREQVNDLTRNPKGTEFNLYTFNAGSLIGGNIVNGLLGEGRFFAPQINPLLDGLTATGADGGCPVRGLDALTQASQNKYDGQAWLYTDGDAQPSTSTDYVQQQLNNRLVSGSIVLLGGCNAAPTVQSNVSGTAKNYLGLAADGSQSAGIVPYLLTAIGTGGQFLYVAPDQLANAVDILRAQASHSAGAGRWSDYVSKRFTYRWDRLTPSEYQWMPTGLLQDMGQLPSATPVRLTLPVPFNFYGTTSSVVDVYEDGYIRMDPCTVNPILCPLLSHYTSILEKDLVWAFVSSPNAATATSVPAATNENGPQVHVYQGGLGINEWHIISTEGIANYGNGDTARRAYQVWLNLQTGEVRYLYNAIRGSDAGDATISVSTQGLILPNEVVVSNQDLAGAVNGGGYKFTPAPPQPSKSYTVTVDSKIQSIGFLQTGYSGSLATMGVTYPDGTPVDCADAANVLCKSLNNGLLQYIQVNVNGKTGVWGAAVNVGSTGEATFSFNALAASPIQPRGLGKRTLSLSDQALRVDLGRTADDGRLTGWLQTATAARFGNAFTFYDDGLHADELASDGIFGSDNFTPPGHAVAYLWTQGTLDGESIARSDPTPFNFQPIDVQPETPYLQSFLGSSVNVGYAVTNQDSTRRCYYWEVRVPTGWLFDGSSGSPFCVAAGATAHPTASFHYPLDDQPGGVTSDFGATFYEAEAGVIVGGAIAKVALFRPLANVAFDNRWIDTYLRPNNTDAVSLTVNLLDDQGVISGWSGNLGYQLNSTLGTVVSPTDGHFEQGRLPLRFTAGTQTGEAVITFVLEGSATATTTLQIQTPSITQLDLVATPQDLRNSNSAALVATALDAWGSPVVGQTVRLSVSDDDGSQGTVNGGEVFTGTTNSNGQVIAAFSKGASAAGTVAVRAESLVSAGVGLRVAHEDVEILTLSAESPIGDRRIYLPLIQR